MLKEPTFLYGIWISQYVAYPDIELGKRSNDFQKPKAHDRRLFPELLLYCEGMPRPTMRGILHLICSILFPFGMWHLFLEAKDRFDGKVAAEIYVFCNFFCCIMSTLYHVGTWPPHIEIVLQKLDHCGIAICSAGINFPVAVLLLPSQYGLPLVILSTFFCLWTCWNILFLKNPGVWRLVLTAGVIAPFFPILCYYLTTFELLCALCNACAQSIGVYIFTKKFPDPFPSIFGYHEIFHVFTVIGFITVYLCNWSIIRRTCNPYAHHLDVTEIIKEWIF
jgi:hemolysin III